MRLADKFWYCWVGFAIGLIVGVSACALDYYDKAKRKCNHIENRSEYAQCVKEY